MRITKFVHACVLVEDGDKAILFDPGSFSWASGLINLETFPDLGTIVVSHKHGDHCDESFVRALATKFPDVQWFAPPDAQDNLRAWGVQNVTGASSEAVAVTVVEHAPVAPFGEQVQNLLSHWNGHVTYPGDSHNFTETKDVLLLPIQAPWGTTIRAIEIIEQLKPRYVLPVHDWMWNEQWRQSSYDRFEKILASTETTFLRPIDGQPIEVNL